MVSTHGYVAVNPPLGAPDTGGQVVYVLELSKKLAQLGYQVDIFTRRFADQPQIDRVSNGVRVVRIPCGGSDFIPKEFLINNLPEWIERTLRFVKAKKLKYQFINSHYWDAGFAAQNIANVLQIPHVHTPHSVGSWKKKQMEVDAPDLKPRFEELYNFRERIRHETILYHTCDILVVTSAPQLDIVREDYKVPTNKIRTIPPGYDDARFYPVSEASRQMIRARLGYGSKKVIANVGRLARNKGVDLLLDAFKVALERYPEIHLRLAVGSEGKRSTLLTKLRKKIRDNRLQKHVTMSGSIPDDELPDFYRAADVFALPSRYEPIGMTAIEAMACGTPVVLTTRGGLYRALSYGEDVLFADPLDKYDFGITLAKVLRFSHLRGRLQQRGALVARSLFTWTGIAQQVLRAVEGRVSQYIEVRDV